MTASLDDFAPALERAVAHARRWLASQPDRAIPPSADADAIAARLGDALPAGPCPPERVIDRLVEAIEPGLMAMGAGRFYGWVIGGALPAALAADWLKSAWDQNTAIR